MVDSDTGLPIGVIDWSDARLTDPAVDFGLVWFDLGVAVVAAALAAYGPVDSDFIDRARWYALHAGIAGVTFRAARDDPHVAAVLARLREVSAEEPGAPRSERHIVDGGDDARHARA